MKTLNNIEQKIFSIFIEKEQLKSLGLPLKPYRWNDDEGKENLEKKLRPSPPIFNHFFLD